MIRPRGYKTFFMLNSAEHEIYPAHNFGIPLSIEYLYSADHTNNYINRLLSHCLAPSEGGGQVVLSIILHT